MRSRHSNDIGVVSSITCLYPADDVRSSMSEPTKFSISLSHHLYQCFSYRVNKRLFPLSITVTVKANRKENFCNKLAARKMSNWMIILEWVFKSVALKNRQTTFLLGYCCLDTVWRHNSRSRKMFFLKIWSCYGHTIYHWKAQ